VSIDKPFEKLDQMRWLHGRSETDVYKLLIDSYRLRTNDEYNMTGDLDERLVPGYMPDEDDDHPFEEYLVEAADKPGLLPAWWSADHVKKCLDFGSKNNYYDVFGLVEKSDIIEQYGNNVMPMQMRMFAEQVLDEPLPGQGGGGDMMRQLQMAIEGSGGTAQSFSSREGESLSGMHKLTSTDKFVLLNRSCRSP
jgi:mitochondrial splicing suppressor protein 51